MNGCAPSEITLGLTRHLELFRQTVPQATNWEDWGLSPYHPDFPIFVMQKIKSASRIHFNLTGMSEIGTPNGVLNGPTNWNPPPSTNWELRTIWDDTGLRKKTTFYQNGKILDEAAVAILP